MPAERSACVCSVLALAAVAQAADFRTTGALTEGVGDPVQIVFLVTGGDQRRVASAEHLARHLRRPGEAPISFHLVTDKAWPSEMVEGWATPHLLSSMPAAALDLHANFSRITHGPGSIYMWKPLLPWLLPESLMRVMVLDADLVLTRSVHELWAQFDTFSASAAVGLANRRNAAALKKKKKPAERARYGTPLVLGVLPAAMPGPGRQEPPT